MFRPISMFCWLVLVTYPCGAVFAAAPPASQARGDHGLRPKASWLTPLADEADWTVGGTQPYGHFGRTVATAGDVNADGWSDLLVGAPRADASGKSSGSVLLYLGSATGLATEPHWAVHGEHAGAQLGAAVATAGDVNGDGYSDVILGAPGTMNSNKAAAGAIYVFFGGGDGLAGKPTLAEADFRVEGIGTGDRFGAAVASAGDVDRDGRSEVLVGSPGAFSNRGWVFLFYGSASGLSIDRHWRASGVGRGDELGSSVSLAGDTNGDGYGDVILGAPGAGAKGRAYLFNGSADGLRTEIAEPGIGQVHITSGGADWRSVDVGSDAARTGASVGTAGDLNGDGYADLVVGAPHHRTSSNGAEPEGLVLVYYGGRSGPRTDWADWGYNCSCPSLRHLGSSVSTAGDLDGDGLADLAVVVPDSSNLVDYPLGKVYVWFGRPSGLPVRPHPEFDYLGEEPDWQRVLGGAFDPLTSVAIAGDVNGDGLSDLALGSPGAESAGLPTGGVQVFHGRTKAPSDRYDWQALGGHFDRALGWSVATAGDLNGDGFADAIVSAPFWTAGTTPAFGRVWVYHGSAAGFSSTPSWICDGVASNGLFGWSVASAGDVNNDGYDDVVIGERVWGSLEPSSFVIAAGRAVVFYGSRQGLKKVYAQLTPSSPHATSDDADWIVYGDDSTYLGHAVSSGGDVNGDGYDDVLVGSESVGVRLFFGSAEGLPTDPASPWGPASISYTEADWVAADGPPASKFGTAVSTAGDVNRDGYADIVVGAPLWHGGGTRRGTAYVYYGTPDGPSPTHDWEPEWGWAHEAPFVGVTDPEILALLPHQDLGVVGYSVTGLGDFNGDGYSDIALGAPFNPLAIPKGPGMAYVFFGGEEGLHPRPAFWIPHIHDGSLFGMSVASAGDVNGDGLADLLVGAPDAISTQESESPLEPTGPGVGAAFIYLGFDVDADLLQEAVPMTSRVWSYFHPHPDGASWWVGSTYFDPNGVENRGVAVASLGWSVSSAGDVNGDGYADILVGAPDLSADWAREGGVFVHYGNGGGKDLVPRQLRHPKTLEPISRMGRLDSANFYLSLRGWSPFGRGKVKLEWELDSLDSPLSGDSLGRAISWADRTGGPFLRPELNLGRVTKGIFHWRARVLYNPATTPLQPHGPWMTPPWDGMQEGDLRLDLDGGGKPLFP